MAIVDDGSQEANAGMTIKEGKKVVDIKSDNMVSSKPVKQNPSASRSGDTNEPSANTHSEKPDTIGKVSAPSNKSFSCCIGCLFWILGLTTFVVVGGNLPRVFPSLKGSDSYAKIMAVLGFMILMGMLVWAAVLICLKRDKTPTVRKKHEEYKRQRECELREELKNFATLRTRFDKLIGKIKERVNEIYQQMESLKQKEKEQTVEFCLSQWPEPIFERMTRYSNLHKDVLEQVQKICEAAHNTMSKMDKVQEDGKGYGTGFLWDLRKETLESIMSESQALFDSLSIENIETTLSRTKLLPNQERIFKMGGQLHDMLSGRITESMQPGELLLERGEKILWCDTAELWLLRTHTNTIRKPRGDSFVDSFLWNMSAENIEDLAADSRVLSRSQRFNHFGSGVLNCTNQRIIFVGETATKTIKWKSIIKFECNYEDRELLIHSSSFQKPILFSDIDAEMFDLVQYCARHPDDSARLAHAPTNEVIAFLIETVGKGEKISSIQNVKFLPPEH
ncbi:MAG: hypothetical protein IKR48_07975 [Kiritimatiellae bacterium]|nr:hypothetical protein [Kiritimatiellia bacterium]